MRSVLARPVQLGAAPPDLATMPLNNPVDFADAVGATLSNFFGPLFGQAFPVYNAANVQIGTVAGKAALAQGKVNFAPGYEGTPLSQVQVVDFMGLLQPASAYLAAAGIAPQWPAAPFQSAAPTGQGITALLFQPASADQYSAAAADDLAAAQSAAADALGNLVPKLPAVDPYTIALWGGLGLLAILAAKRGLA